MRICFFGDSFVNGTGDDECLGWTGRLCATARRTGWDVTHYNLGVRGDTSADVAARWRREAEARLRGVPDGRLVFAFGANDCLPDGRGGVRVPADQSIASARAILTEARDWKPTLMIGPLPVGDDPAADARIAALSGSLATLCHELAVPYLCVFEAMRRDAGWIREARAADGSHPGTEGYRALAEIVATWEGWRAWFRDRSTTPAERRDA